MLITMNDRELQRLTIIQDVLHQNLSRRDALKLLGLSYRQLQRLITRFLQQGAASLVHGNRGKPSSNRVNESVKLQALELIHQYYSDFGPTLAHEKLEELHDVSVSLKTLRQWMIANGLWTPYSRHKPRIYLMANTITVNIAELTLSTR